VAGYTAASNEPFAFLLDHNLVGNDTNDAWLAALAMEHRATLVSTDNGFSRFPGLKWLDPTKRA